jgi:hypothetical protein
MLKNAAPSGIADALGKVVIPNQVGRLQVLVRDGVVLARQGERRLVVTVLSLTAHSLMRLRQRSGWRAP